jgi:hypothetical protein
MQPMGALQPGIPSPTAIPLNYCLCVLDLKDAFFTIPLHPKDGNKFAFILPCVCFSKNYSILPSIGGYHNFH